MTLRSVVMTSQGFAGISQGKREDDAKMEAALVERCKKILEETPQATSFFRWKWDEIQLGKRMTRHVTPKKGRNIDQNGRFSSEELRCGTPCLGLHLDFKKLALLTWLQWFLNSLTSSYLFITREVQPVDSVAFLKLVRYVPFCWRAQSYLAMPKHWEKQLLGIDIGRSDDEKRWEQLLDIMIYHSEKILYVHVAYIVCTSVFDLLWYTADIQVLPIQFKR